MKTLAVCFYGTNTESTKLVDSVKFKFSNFKVTIFSATHQERSAALLISCNKKRSHELSIFKEFDICLAVDTLVGELIDFTEIKNELKNNIVYYTKGYFRSDRRSTGVSPSIFYAKSLTFDRAAEFKTNLQYIETGWLREITPESVFFYHLNTMNIKTECINYENSSLFIRSA